MRFQPRALRRHSPTDHDHRRIEEECGRPETTCQITGPLGHPRVIREVVDGGLTVIVFDPVTADRTF